MLRKVGENAGVLSVLMGCREGTGGGYWGLGGISGMGWGIDRVRLGGMGC